MPHATSNAKFLNALPPNFKQNVIGVCGEEGNEWLEALPELIRMLQDEWKITVGPYFPNISYNFVAPVKHEDGSSFVIKLGLPANDGEAEAERAYLDLLNGHGAVRIIKNEPGRRALLLERATPGRDIRELFKVHPSLAVDAAIATLKDLPTTAPFDDDDLILLESWSQKLSDVSRYGFPEQYAEKALKIFSGMERSTLLHGDFHHENILSNGGSYLVIDPKGLIGDRRYDIAVFLNNHRGWMTDRQEDLSNSVNRFAAAFGFTAKEIREMAFAQKVLAAFWMRTEGRESWQRQLASADIWDV